MDEGAGVHVVGELGEQGGVGDRLEASRAAQALPRLALAPELPRSSPTAFPATKVACPPMLALRRLTTLRWAGPGVFGAASAKKQWAMSGVPPPAGR